MDVPNEEVGLRVDIVEIARMRKIIDRSPAFVEKVYSAAERAYCDSHAHPEVHYATRFAAKEAVLKALGTGFSEGIGWLDVEVRRTSKGRPYVVLTGRAREVAREQGVREIPLSLSYTHTDAVACAMAGMIAGCITVTGLASKLISGVIAISSAIPNPTLSLLLALFLKMLCCIVLGMGVPTTANYCIMASTCAPILIKMGYPLVAAHFFVFYFGIVADITPPVALAAYAGSAIAKSNPMKTGINATKLAIAAFIVPFIFAYNPQMLFENVTSVFQIIQIVITALLGIFAVAAGLEGYILRPMHWPLRVLAVIGGLTLLIPGTVSDLIGLVIVAGIIALQVMQNKKAAREAV